MDNRNVMLYAECLGTPVKQVIAVWCRRFGDIAEQMTRSWMERFDNLDTLPADFLAHCFDAALASYEQAQSQRMSIQTGDGDLAKAA